MNTNLISDLQDFMFNEENIKSYLSIRNEYNSEKQNKVTENNNKKQNIKPLEKKQTMYFPGQQDSLFWCYYIIANGDVKYEMLQNKNFLLAKQMKIDLVDKIRKNKHIVKMYKFDTLSGIESNLANDTTINAKTFCTLCAIENINIIYIKKNTYFELLMNDTNIIYIVKEVEGQSKYVSKYGFEIATKEMLKTIDNSLYKIENINKPIKCETAYKVQELIDICSKLGIELNNESKKKTKKELYELIIQYF
jgi:hypothetical protein